MIFTRISLIWSLICIHANVADISQRYGDHFYYQCDAETPYNRHKPFLCQISITADHLAATKLITFHADYHKPITMLRCIDCQLSKPMRSIFTSFPRLKELDLSNGTIETVSAADIRPAEELISIDMSSNRLDGLKEARLFANSTHLRRLNLSHNRLRSLDAATFYGIHHLEVLQLHHNQLTHLDAISFSELPKLQQLLVHSNRLKTFQFEHVQRNVQLLRLTLHSNSITTIADNMFDHIRTLDFLDLSDNALIGTLSLSMNATKVNVSRTNITELTVGSAITHVCAVGGFHLVRIHLTDADRLISLNVSNNRLTQLLVDSPELTTLDAANNSIAAIKFGPDTALTMLHLNLSTNRLTTLANVSTLTQLTELDVSENPLNTLELFAFAEMEQLQLLRLRRIGFERLQFGQFSFQHRLRVLDISYNNVARLDLNVFYTMAALAELYVDGNNLPTINVAELRSHFPHLERIGVADNAWNCTELTRVLRLLAQERVSVHVSRTVKNRPNVKGIGCNDGVEKMVTLLRPVVANSTTTTRNGSDTAEWSKQFAELRRYVDGQLMALTLRMQSMNASVHQERAFNVDNIHMTNNILNARINEKYGQLEQQLGQLTKRLNDLVVASPISRKNDLKGRELTVDGDEDVVAN